MKKCITYNYIQFSKRILYSLQRYGGKLIFIHIFITHLISLNLVLSQVNGRLILEGRLHVYWRVLREIQLLESDDSRLSRSSNHMPPARSLSHGPSSVSSDDLNGGGSPPIGSPVTKSSSTLPSSFDAQQTKAQLAGTLPVLRGPSENDEDNVVMRTGSQQVHFYRRSINGHRFEGVRS